MPGLSEFVAKIDSEASDTKSPHFEDVAGAKVLWDTLSGVGTTPMEKVEMEEEEEENLDVYFKRMRKGKPRKKKVMKKPRCHTPVTAESESVAIVSPPASLVIKLSMQKKAPEKAVPALRLILVCKMFNCSLFPCT